MPQEKKREYVYPFHHNQTSRNPESGTLLGSATKLRKSHAADKKASGTQTGSDIW